MGAKHATLRSSRGPSPQEQLPRSFSFAERFLPRCLMPENGRECDDDEDGGDGEEHGAEKGGKGRLPTLEEWILASPGVEVQHRRQSPKVCPLSPSVVGTVSGEASTPSDYGEDHGAEQGGKERLPTLAEWLFASPGIEVQLHRRQSPKLCPLSPSVVGYDRRFPGVEASMLSSDSEDHGAEQGGKGRLPTLAEWFLASPEVEAQLHRQQSLKVCPLSPSVVGGCNHRFAGVVATTPSSSSTVERDSFSRSQSSRRRRVNFRLPAEGDIIVISSRQIVNPTENKMTK